MSTWSATTARPQVRIAHLQQQVLMGGGAPVVVQAMTNTDTADISASVKQIQMLAVAGAELVRITVNNAQAAAAVPKIRERLDVLGCHVPLIGDFHYNGHTLLQDDTACAQALSKYRINPGNVGYGKKKDLQFAQIVELACRYQKAVRIGVNWGSLDQALLARMMDANAALASPQAPEVVLRQALITSVLESSEAAIDIGLAPSALVLSCKVSKVPDLIWLYQELARQTPLALHLGLTEAGMGLNGMVSSSAGLAVLLQQGIGDTIRVSLTPRPGGDRTEEVQVAQALLQSLGLRYFSPTVTACPGCGRTTSSLFQTLAQEVELALQAERAQWRTQYPGAETLKVAVMGCIVNGPGESKHAHIGISLPGTGELPVAPVFIDGEKAHTLRGDDLAQQFMAIVRQYVAHKFAATQ